MKNLVAWAVALMLAKAPLSIADAPAFPGWSETQAQRLERYHGIAEAAVAVGRDRRTVAKLLAVSFHESGWARDVDLGPACYRGKDGKSTRCDSGRAACMMQVRVDVHKQWTAAELFGDRAKCFTAGLEILEKSERACVSLGPDFAFDSYAGGFCIDNHELATKAHVRGLELLHLSERFRAWEPITLANAS